MKNRRLAMLSLLITALAGAAQAQTQPMAAASSLVGRWTVDLRPRSDAAPYLKKLVITAVTDGRIEGHFYDGSPLQAGRVNVNAAPEPHFAFFTDPGEGVYQSAGRQVSRDRLEGMTLSTTRGFLLPWTAVRDAAP
jgi:hypothetical protein